MHSPRPAHGRSAAICAVLLLAACDAGTDQPRTVITGYLSLTSVQGPDLPAADDPMLPVLGETARLTIRTAHSSFWNVNVREGVTTSEVPYWSRDWSYSSQAADERPDFEPDASGYLQIIVEPAFAGRSAFLMATRFADQPGLVQFIVILTGEGFRLELSCPNDTMKHDADGFPLAPTELVLSCAVTLCRDTPRLCLQGPGMFEFDLPKASIPTSTSTP